MERTAESGELAVGTLSKGAAERVAASAAWTGADFQTDSVTAAIVCCWGRHCRSESLGPFDWAASTQDAAHPIALTSPGCVDSDRAVADPTSAATPIARSIKRRTDTFWPAVVMRSNGATAQAFGFELGFGCGAGFGIGLGFG